MLTHYLVFCERRGYLTEWSTVPVGLKVKWAWTAHTAHQFPTEDAAREMVNQTAFDEEERVVVLNVTIPES